MSSLLSALATDASTIIEPVLANLAQTKTVQILEEYLLDIALAVAFHQTTIHVDGYAVTASINSQPVALTFAAAYQAIENIKSGSLGSFQVGDVVVSIEKASSST